MGIYQLNLTISDNFNIIKDNFTISVVNNPPEWNNKNATGVVLIMNQNFDYILPADLFIDRDVNIIIKINKRKNIIIISIFYLHKLKNNNILN